MTPNEILSWYRLSCTIDQERADDHKYSVFLGENARTADVRFDAWLMAKAIRIWEARKAKRTGAAGLVSSGAVGGA